jgi:acyl carrier protein
MDRSVALEALRNAAVDVLKVDASQVIESASFAEDLEADSLDLVELVMRVEELLDATIDQDNLADVRTVGDAVDVIVGVASEAA